MISALQKSSVRQNECAIAGFADLVNVVNGVGMKTRNNRLNIVMLFIVQILEQLAMVSMRTVVTPYAKDELSISVSLLGVLTGALAIASMASRFSASGLMRRFPYLTLIRVSIAIELIAYLLYLPARYFVPLMAVRLIGGFFLGVTGTAIIALAGTMFSVDRMGFGMGIFGYSQMAALGIGPSLSMAIYNNFGSRVFFLSELVLEGAVLAMTFFVKETDESRAAVSNARNSVSKGKTDLFKKLSSIILPSALFPSFLNFFLQVAYASVSTFIIIYGQDKGWKNVGLFYTIYAIGSLIVRPVLGAVLDKKGLTLPVSICGVSFSLSMLVLAKANSFTVFLLAACLMTIGFGGGWTVCQASALKCKDVKDKGAASATYFLLNDLGMLIGSTLAGACAEVNGYSKTFIIFIIPIVMSWIVYHVALFTGRLKKA